MDSTILVVEDHDDTRTAIQSFLMGYGYNVVTAGNGRAALQVLQTGVQPCLIILDLLMPDMMGPAFRAAQLANQKWADIPVVVLSAAHSAEEEVQRLGIAAFLHKPAEPAVLLKLVRRYCGDSLVGKAGSG